MMDLTGLNHASNTKMTTADFVRISSFISKHYGIKMPDIKKVMLESRLQKRLKTLNIPSFREYADYVFSIEGKNEIVHMIDAVTTNKTDFFREHDHFTFLTSCVLPDLVTMNHRKIRIWSAGCSSGEEAYTLAMVLSEFRLSHMSLEYHIWATDICSDVLTKATTAVYAEERIAHLPLNLRTRYFLKSKDQKNKTVRVVPSLRSRVTFQRLNFMADHYETAMHFDIIFCRNVLIYFNKETQEGVINKLASKLVQGGFFFLGHSESITGMDVPLMQVKPTIFKKI